jgi:hypothetical protein
MGMRRIVNVRSCVSCSAQIFHFHRRKNIKCTFDNFVQNEVKYLWLVLLCLFSFLSKLSKDNPYEVKTPFFHFVLTVSLRFVFISFR